MTTAPEVAFNFNDITTSSYQSLFLLTVNSFT